MDVKVPYISDTMLHSCEGSTSIEHFEIWLLLGKWLINNGHNSLNFPLLCAHYMATHRIAERISFARVNVHSTVHAQKMLEIPCWDIELGPHTQRQYELYYTLHSELLCNFQWWFSQNERKAAAAIMIMMMKTDLQTKPNVPSHVIH